jgi:DNA repair exonuclease SbcCD nuclease subunit
MTYRFLHSSDLHLGKAFGGYPEAIRNRLREARHLVISRLAETARRAGVKDVLLAGDTFDAETPSPETLRHALRAMAAEADIRWLMLPGNHDSLAASELWLRIAAERPDNLQAIATPAPLELAPAVWLLPAPCTQRRPGRDLTEAMSAATPPGALRIGLGHGAITDFSGEEGAAGIIPPDRARLSGLDYLGLGDWHGQMQIGASSWYSGTPEADGFKHETAPAALLVHLPGQGQLAQVEPRATGLFTWQALHLDVLPGEDTATRLAEVLPAPARRRDSLLRLTVGGRLPLADHAALGAQLAALAPDFGWFDAGLSGLAIDARAQDLDLIDRGGALRAAAELLLAEVENPALAQETRDLAQTALGHLFAFVQEVQA